MSSLQTEVITIRIEGKGEEGGHVRLEDFISQLQSFEDVLIQTAHILSKPHRPKVKFRIVSATHTSPISLGLEPVPLEDKDIEYTPFLGKKVLATSKSIDSGKVPADVDLQTLRTYRKMIEGIDTGEINKLSVSIPNQTFSVTDKFVKNLDGAIRTKEKELLPEARESGSLKGQLVGLKLWGKKTLYIEPNIGPTRVECHFDDKDVEYHASKSVKRFVVAHGVLHYTEGKKFPLRIQVEELSVLPEEGELPGMGDLHGMSPDLTGDESVNDLLESSRFDW